MRVVVTKHNVHLILGMAKMAKVLGSEQAMTEAHRGVIDAGRKTKTQVQRAVHRQMAMKSYQFVSSNTRGTPVRADLAYDIYAYVGGQRVEKYKGLRALSPKGDVYLRYNAAMDPGDKGQVKSGVWNVPRVFKRSFAGNSGFFALLPGTGGRAPKAIWTYGHKPNQPRDGRGRFAPSGKTYGKVRRLFGPSLSKEIPKDDSLATFLKVAPPLLEQHVMKRLSKYMRF